MGRTFQANIDRRGNLQDQSITYPTDSRSTSVRPYYRSNYDNNNNGIIHNGNVKNSYDDSNNYTQS